MLLCSGVECSSRLVTIWPWAYGKEKIRGTERNLPDSVSDCARVVKKIFRRNFPKLLLTGGSGYEKFLLDSIFPTKLTEFPTKWTEFVPFIFVISQYCPIVKRILPDWLCLPPPARYAHDHLDLFHCKLTFEDCRLAVDSS
jgi:hypothetical protein